MLKLHVITEIEMISNVRNLDQAEKTHLRTSLDLRLEAIGPFLPDKQYILGVRRAVMELSKSVSPPLYQTLPNLSRYPSSKIDVASAWLTSAK